MALNAATAPAKVTFSKRAGQTAPARVHNREPHAHGRNHPRHLTDRGLNRIAATMDRARSHVGGSDFEAMSTFLRRAAFTYVDFHERMLAGELDDVPSAHAVIRAVEGLDHLATPSETVDYLTPRRTPQTTPP